MEEKTVKKIYLSGPITGRRREEVEKHFMRAGWRLIYEHGQAGETVQVISLDALSGMELTWESYMRIAQAIIEDPSIDGIHMLRGWERSKGCNQEIIWAMGRELPVTYEPGAVKFAVRP